MAVGNGVGWKVAMYLLGVLVAIGMAWTKAVSEDVDAVSTRQTTTEENVRTIHYEAEVQRLLMKRIAEKVGAETSDVPDVRPLRETQ